MHELNFSNDGLTKTQLKNGDLYEAVFCQNLGGIGFTNGSNFANDLKINNRK